MASTYPHLEIIVVNDGSTDGTDEVVRRFLAERGAAASARRPITYRIQANGGKSPAINHGITVAAGDIVVTIDSDSVVDSHAIANIVRRFREDDTVMSVAGNVKIGNRTHTIGLIQQLEYLYGFYFKKADSILNSIYIVGGAAAAYRREVFARVGLFDEKMITEDIEMSTRIQSAGLRIAYAPDAVVYTEGPTQLRGLLKQRLRWKYGRILTFYKYRHLFFSLAPQHSKVLTLLVLPVAALADCLLLIEAPLLFVFYSYTFGTGNFGPLMFNLVLVTLAVVLQVLTDPKPRENLHLLVVAPVAWLFLYVVDLIEFQALVRSLLRLSRGRRLTWQRWSRTGVFGSDACGVGTAARAPSRPPRRPGRRGSPPRSPGPGGRHAAVGSGRGVGVPPGRPDLCPEASAVRDG